MCAALAIALLAFSAIPKALSTSIPLSSTAQKFILANASGHTLAILGALPSADGTGYGLTFHDSAGKQTIELGNSGTSSGPTVDGLWFYDGNQVLHGSGKYRAWLGIAGPSATTSPAFGLGLYDGKEDLRGYFVSALPDGTGLGAALIDPNGAEFGLSDTPSSNEGQGFGGFFDYGAKGYSRAYVGQFLNGKQSYLGVADPNGTTAGIADVQSSNAMSIFVQDPEASATNGAKGRGTFDELALDGSFHDIFIQGANGTNESHQSTDVLLGEFNDSGSIKTYNAGTETGHLP